MADSEELKKLLFTFKRIADSLESQSATGSSHQVRYGRGGNSNGVPPTGSDNYKYDKKALEDTAKAAELFAKRSDTATQMWVSSIRKATGFNNIFGERLKDTIEAIDRHNDKQSDATRAVTVQSMELAKQHGLQSKILKDANASSITYVETMADLVTKHKEKKRIENIDIEIATANARRSEEMGKKKHLKSKEALAAIDEEIKELKALKKTLPEVNSEIDRLQAKMIKARAAAGDMAPALTNVSDSALGVVNANGASRIAFEDLVDTLDELDPNIRAQINTYRALHVEMVKFKKKVEESADAIGAALLQVAKGLGSAIPAIINNFRDQLKYNVKESNYADAAMMGLSEGELSRTLGENADTFRGVTGSGDNRAILDGTLQELQHTVTALYGEAGPDAMKRIAQMTLATQGAGISTRDKAFVVEDRLKDFSEMADRLGMVKGELVDFASKLSESGDMAYLAGKYDQLNATEAQAAMDRELEARIANAKMLGLGTQHVKEQIALERKNRYGTMENQIQSMIGGKMDASIARKNGVSVSAGMEAVIQKKNLGQDLTQDEQRQYDAFQFNSRNAMETGMDSATASGNTSAYLGFGMQRTLSQKFGSDAFTEEGMKQAEAQRAMRSRFTDSEKEAFDRDGTVPEMYRQTGGLASDGNTFNSSLMPFDQTANSGKTIWDGIAANPLMAGIGTGVAAIAINTAKMAYFSGGIGKGTGIGNIGRGALATGAKSGMGKAGGALLSSVGIKGVGAAGRVAAGGLMGMGVGLVGTGVDYLGENIKAGGVAEGDLTNDRIFDKATAGATTSIAGKALSYGATGALIGSVVPVVGTALGGAIGAVVGAGMGVVDNFDVIKSNFNTLQNNLVGPSETLEKTTQEAQKARENSPKTPTEVVLSGAQGEAIVKSGVNSDKLTETAKQQLGEHKKTNEFQKSREDIKAMLAAQKANVAATENRFANLDNS